MAIVNHEKRTSGGLDDGRSAYIGGSHDRPRQRLRDPPRPPPAAASGSRPATRDPSGRPSAGPAGADVAIVGAGFTGLWAAIALLDTDPSLRVVVLEADRVGWGASGRNGGFCEASLTHGLSNGLLHFQRGDRRSSRPRAGGTSPSWSRSCGTRASTRSSRRPGTLGVATPARTRSTELRAYVELAASGTASGLQFLDREAIQAEVHSPRWLAGVRAGPEHCVMVNPAKLAWGLAAAAERRGATIFEDSRVTGIRRRAGGVTRRRRRRRRRSRPRTCSWPRRRTAAGCGGSCPSSSRSTTTC